ncbi:MAG: DUF4369 domain-containing protein [Muribaculaceae bacterium]|nr:DUF4369 domain-containing protein [Muribaculaceae bacterium]
MKRILIPAMALLAACTPGSKGWSVDGTVKDGEGRRMAIEAFNAGNWYVVDSVTIGSNGTFSYKAETPAPFADVYRLNLDGRCIYFPVDSIDAIKIDADTAAFSSNYTLSGSQAAEKIQAIDRLIAETVATRGEINALSDSTLKAKLSDIAINDTTCIAAYYIINKNIAGRPLFDLTQRRDLGVVGAVAQRFADHRPDDVRTKWLSAIFLNARRQLFPSNTGLTMEVEESGLIDIVRFDNKGQRQSLAEVAGKGVPTVLSFTSYELESSPAYNIILADLQKRYTPERLQIYQIAFDTDEVEWKQKADNLPWITVWNSPVDGSDVLMKYNIGALPIAYVINKQGILTERITDPEKLAAAVAKVM